MAAIELREGKHGLVRRKYCPKNLAEGLTQRDLGSEGTEPPENEETRLSESPPDEKAA